MCVYILLAVNTGRASAFGRSKEIAKITSKKCYVSSETSLLIANIACVRMWMISFYQKIFSPILIKPLLAYFLFYFWKKTSRKTKLSLILVPIPDFEKQFLFHSVSCILWAWQQTFQVINFICDDSLLAFAFLSLILSDDLYLVIVAILPCLQYLKSTRSHSVSTCAKFSEKLTFLTPECTRLWAYQGVRNVSFSENFAYVFNGWIPTSSKTFKYRLSTWFLSYNMFYLAILKVW